jgi:hypothetical protein
VVPFLQIKEAMQTFTGQGMTTSMLPVPAGYHRKKGSCTTPSPQDLEI